MGGASSGLGAGLGTELGASASLRFDLERSPSRDFAPRSSDALQAEIGRPLPLLSVVIPVYNERHTLGRVLVAVSRALPGVRKNAAVVDDWIGDGTRESPQANFLGE